MVTYTNEQVLLQGPAKSLSNGQIWGSLLVQGGGSGYTSTPSVSITGGGGSGATATAIMSVGRVDLGNQGSGYTSHPNVIISDPPAGGVTAKAYAKAEGGSVVSIYVAGDMEVLKSSSFLTFKDSTENVASDMFVITSYDNGDSPLLAFTQGAIMEKDLMVGGLVDSGQGTLWLNHGLVGKPILSSPPNIGMMSSSIPYPSGSNLPNDPETGQLFNHNGTKKMWDGSNWVTGNFSGYYDTLFLFTDDGKTRAHLDLGDLTADGYIYANNLSPVPEQEWIDVHSKLRINGDLQLVDGKVASSLNPVDDGLGLGSPTEPWTGIACTTVYTDNIKDLAGEDWDFPWNGGTVTNMIAITSPNLLASGTPNNNQVIIRRDSDLVYICPWGTDTTTQVVSIGGGANCGLRVAGTIYVGTAMDVYLYRQTSPSTCLETNASMIIDGALNVSGISCNGSLGISKDNNNLFYVSRYSAGWAGFPIKAADSDCLWVAFQNSSGDNKAVIRLDSGQLQIPVNGSSAGIAIGDDTQIYREAANVLRTPGALQAIQIRVNRPNSTDDAYYSWQDGDSIGRFYIRADGHMYWGDGSPLDTELKRASANLLYTSDSFKIDNGVLGFGDSYGAPAQSSDSNGTKINLYATGGNWDYQIGVEASTVWLKTTNYFKWYANSGPTLLAQLNSSGQLYLPINGSGGGLKIGDVTMYRDSASVLRLQNDLIIDEYLYVGSDAVIGGSLVAGSTVDSHNVSLVWTGGQGYVTSHTGNLNLTATGALELYSGGNTEFRPTGDFIYIVGSKTISPSSNNLGNIGGDGSGGSHYWGSGWFNYLRYKDLDSFDALDDLALVKNYKTKVVVKEGVEREVVDLASIPHVKADSPNDFVDAGKLNGFLLGCVKALVLRMEKLEEQLKNRTEKSGEVEND